MNRKSHIFLSYARATDKHHSIQVWRYLLLGGLAEACPSQQFDIFLDRSDTPFGEKWERYISDVLMRSQFFFALVTEAYLKSKWCNWECNKFVELREDACLIPVIYNSNALDLYKDSQLYKLLMERQFFDFGNLLKEQEKSPLPNKVRESMLKLAARICSLVN